MVRARLERRSFLRSRAAFGSTSILNLPRKIRKAPDYRSETNGEVKDEKAPSFGVGIYGAYLSSRFKVSHDMVLPLRNLALAWAISRSNFGVGLYPASSISMRYSSTGINTIGFSMVTGCKEFLRFAIILTSFDYVYQTSNRLSRQKTIQ
ncbi:hypothetical protein LCGC14_1213360 [marine sediment metagenome]|uniref:Uncharacterized protein n=1 Tax=marine sediment metagenome TaxID=412755 RepID=A0A0F9M0T1_9ZZZZ